MLTLGSTPGFKFKGVLLSFIAALVAFSAPLAEARTGGCLKAMKELAADSDNKELRREVERRLAEKLAQWLTRFHKLPKIAEFAAFASVSESQIRSFFKDRYKSESMENFFDKALKAAPFEFDTLGDSMAKNYARLSKESMREISIETFAESMNIDAKILNKLFGKGRLFKDFEELQARARELKPNDFKKVIGDEFLSEEHRDEVMKAIATHSRYFVTTAGAYDEVHEGFYKSLIKAAEELDAIIIVRPANFETEGLDERLLNHPRIFVSLDGLELGETMNFNEIQILKKMMRQLTGIERIGDRGQIQIIGGTHLEVKTQATPRNSERPHIVLTTGAITKANNAGKVPVQKRSDKFGNDSHKLGAVLVERGNRGTEDFFWRHVEYKEGENGEGFMDLNRFYTPSGSRKVKIETLVLGDIHVGDTDPAVLAALPKLIEQFGVEILVNHDIFNGHSINHHESEMFSILAQKYREGRLDLEKEIKDVQAFLKWQLSLSPKIKVRISKSNHDLFLNRWLEKGMFIRDPINSKIGGELFARMSDTSLPVRERDPLKYAVLRNADFDTSRVEFLDVGEGSEVGPAEDPVQVGYHGHVAENGRPGSPQQFERAGKNIITGHSHTIWRLNDAVGVGTFTKHIVGYNKDGFSNWVQSLVLVGPNGEKQQLVFRDGWWFAEETTDSDRDFGKNYPSMLRHEVSEDGMGQIDQYIRSSRR